MANGDESVNELNFADAQRDVRALRRSLQEGVQVEPAATSIDGRTFEFQTRLDDPLPLGGFALITTTDSHRYLGQITRKSLRARDRARVRLDVPEVSLGAATISSAEIALEARMAAGIGTLLARLDGDELSPTSLDDVFDGAAIEQADSDLLASFLAYSGAGAAALDVGWSPYAGPSARIGLRSGGFNRHTFLCGQSGSGKTFSLGVVLERLLLDTTLPMIIIDPNSDFVGLPELRPADSFARTVRSVPGDYAEQADRYRATAAGVKVLRSSGADDLLRIRFSELTSAEQATVLKLDPLEHRAEFGAYRRMSEQMGDTSYSLHDMQDAINRILQEDARQIGLRMANLGLGDWDVWAESDEGSLSEHLLEGHRGLVLDVGGFGTADEKNVVAMSLLGRLWRRREERQPVLVVIDEAHNVCPAEPTSDLQALATEHVVRIAGEGRKFGIYLLLSTQRPQKLHPNVLSQCDNLMLMRMNSQEDVAHLESSFSFVPPGLLEQATGFKLGQALVAGKISPTPMLVQIEGRYSPEGGGDVPSTWASAAAASGS